MLAISIGYSGGKLYAATLIAVKTNWRNRIGDLFNSLLLYPVFAIILAGPWPFWAAEFADLSNAPITNPRFLASFAPLLAGFFAAYLAIKPRLTELRPLGMFRS